MKKEELSKILEDHKLWVETRFSSKRKGCRADLRHADLSYADLHDADLFDADLRHADLSHADLHGANLFGADLHDADLVGANLSGANLDFSCLPLWCGSLKANMADRQVKQLLYHTLSIVVNSSNVSDELKQQLLTDENLRAANEFHRVGECQRLTK